MKRTINPAIVAAILLLALGVLGVVFWRAAQPPPTETGMERYLRDNKKAPPMRIGQ